jgi:predicted phosphohydrolase
VGGLLRGAGSKTAHERIQMKIVCISDTHQMHERVTVPDGDVLIHAGDMTMTGDLARLRDFSDWLGGLPHDYKIVVAGNHDKRFQMLHDKHDCRRIIEDTGAFYLEDAAVEIDDVIFYGSPWTPSFGYGWAFNADRGEEIAAKWAKIRSDTNVLITHGPPHELLDYVPGRGGGFVGCQDLRQRIGDLGKLRLHVFGHIHEGYGITRDGVVTLVNASICNAEYAPINKPIVIEWESLFSKPKGEENEK